MRRSTTNSLPSCETKSPTTRLRSSRRSCSTS
jgi:hypothetical protein